MDVKRLIVIGFIILIIVALAYAPESPAKELHGAPDGSGVPSWEMDSASSGTASPLAVQLAASLTECEVKAQTLQAEKYVFEARAEIDLMRARVEIEKIKGYAEKAETEAALLREENKRLWEIVKALTKTDNPSIVAE